MSAATLAAFIARCRILYRPHTNSTDADLLERFTRRRDADAFAQILERYAGLVWGVCRRIMPQESDCEDAFQAVFLAMVRRSDLIDPRQSLGAWLHTVAMRMSRKALLRSHRHQPSMVVPERATTGDVADEVSSRELFRIVDEEIERLPIAVRVPLILCCLEGRTRDEAAAVLGCSVAAVKSRLERGRNQLRRRLERRGLQLPAAFLVLGLTSERIRAALWNKTIQSVLHTPVPAIAALADAGITAVTMGKGKLLLAALLLISSAAGATSLLLTENKTKPPAASAWNEHPTSEPKRNQAPQVRIDRHGDPLPEGALARLGTMRWRHGIFVQTLAYSPDGKMIVSSGGRALIFWDAATGKESRQFPISNGGQVRGVAFSPDGKLFATTGRTAQLWDIASGKMLRELKNVPSRVIALAFSPDGKLLASGYLDGTLSLEDVAGGDEKRRIDSGQGGVNTVAFAPDGKLLASGGSDSTIRLWDAVTGKEVHRLTAPKKELSSVVFSPDGKLLASGSNEDSLRLWDVATGRQIRTLGEKKRHFTAIAFSPDGKLLASGHLDGTLSLWDTSNGEQKRHWQAALDGCSLAFCPDGKTLATAGRMGSVIRLWDMGTGKERHPSEGHNAPVSLLRFAPDKRTLISAGGDQRMVWWDLTTQTPRRQFDWTTYSFTGFTLSPNGNTLATDDFKTHEVWLWDVQSGKSTRLPGKHQDLILAIAFSPDGQLLASAGGRDQPIRIWDVQQGKEVRQIKGFTNPVAALRFAPDGKTLACGAYPRRNAANEPTLRLWDVSSGKERCTFDSHIPIDFALAFSQDGKVLASGDGYGGTDEALVRLWDTTTGKELCRHAGHPQMIGAVAFSPDGKLVASGTGRTQDFANLNFRIFI
jgi:RNA polymerase sigma factor (sigma-70 family)